MLRGRSCARRASHEDSPRSNGVFAAVLPAAFEIGGKAAGPQLGQRHRGLDESARQRDVDALVARSRVVRALYVALRHAQRDGLQPQMTGLPRPHLERHRVPSPRPREPAKLEGELVSARRQIRPEVLVIVERRPQVSRDPEPYPSRTRNRVHAVHVEDPAPRQGRATIRLCRAERRARLPAPRAAQEEGENEAA